MGPRDAYIPGKTFSVHIWEGASGREAHRQCRRTTSPRVGGPQPVLCGPGQDKRWRKVKFTVSAWAGSSILCCSWLPVLLVLVPSCSPGLPAGGGQTLTLLSLHNFASQFLIIHLFLVIYRAYWFCFSGETWLIYQQGLSLVWHPPTCGQEARSMQDHGGF